MAKNIIRYGIWFLLIPAAIVLGITVFEDRQYAFVSLAVAALALIPLFMSFERRAHKTTELVVIAVMTALSVLGRFVFAAVPGFKPVSAIVIITAMYLGGEAGFVTGALSAFISNFYFGQGAWTPFQMFAWGTVGFLGGLLARPLKRSRIVLAVYGVFAGVLYSFLMDIWTVIWIDGYFNLPRYFTAIGTAASVTVIYAVSNVVFLELFSYPIGKILGRVKTKYGL